jgi:hypothetical protein
MPIENESTQQNNSEESETDKEQNEEIDKKKEELKKDRPELSEEQIQEMIEKKTGQEAMEQTLKHFQIRESQLPNFLNTHNKKIQQLLNFAIDEKQNKGQINKNDLHTELDEWNLSTEEAEEKIPMILHVIGNIEKTLNLKRPIEAVRELFDKGLKELMSSDVRLKDAERKFNEGKSWYHTTEQGKRMLIDIRNKIESEVRAQMALPRKKRRL